LVCSLNWVSRNKGKIVPKKIGVSNFFANSDRMRGEDWKKYIQQEHDKELLEEVDGNHVQVVLLKKRHR